MATRAIRAVLLVAFLDLFIQLPVISAYAKSPDAAPSKSPFEDLHAVIPLSGDLILIVAVTVST